MFMLDAWAVSHARRLPGDLLAAASRFTDLGKSGYFLWPLGIVMLALVALYSPAVPRFWRGVLAAWAVRIGFVFTFFALPSSRGGRVRCISFRISSFDAFGRRLISHQNLFPLC